ncbi:MAG: serine--tRNA ligase [Pseudomonadota bacterium]|nr:serine--tRNA ligase [Pseudomonadota bacterium]
MLEANHLRLDLDHISRQLAKKGHTLDKNAYQKLEAERKHWQSKCEILQAERNQLAKIIGQKKSKGEDASQALERSQAIMHETKEAERSLKIAQSNLYQFAASLPNLPHESTPFGQSEHENVEIKRVGEPLSYDFDIKSHTQLCGDYLNMAKASQLSGSRFPLLVGPLAKLNRVLANWMMNEHLKHGYTEINVPVLVKPDALFGTGQLPKFREDQFVTNTPSELTLIPTAEVPITNIAAGEIWLEDQLPKRYCAHSLCFRKEAGTYGQDSNGLFRVHQFEKVELVHLCTPEESAKELELLCQQACLILDKLKIPYRVIELCSGDLGFSAQKTYDIEVWMASQHTYREVSSCSNMSDFQARRMKARYRPSSQPKKTSYIHTLNGSALAIGRTLIAIIEHYQTANGQVKIPSVLQDSMGTDYLF